jgi:hypothetical protein
VEVGRLRRLGYASPWGCSLPRSIGYTVAYSMAGETVDLCKIIIGGDGSYYITAPFHPHNKALAAIMTVNYAKPSPILRGLCKTRRMRNWETRV